MLASICANIICQKPGFLINMHLLSGWKSIGVNKYNALCLFPVLNSEINVYMLYSEAMCQQYSMVNLFGQTKDWNSYSVHTWFTFGLTALPRDTACTV